MLPSPTHRLGHRGNAGLQDILAGTGQKVADQRLQALRLCNDPLRVTLLPLITQPFLKQLRVPLDTGQRCTHLMGQYGAELPQLRQLFVTRQPFPPLLVATLQTQCPQTKPPGGHQQRHDHAANGAGALDDLIGLPGMQRHAQHQRFLVQVQLLLRLEHRLTGTQRNPLFGHDL